MLDKQLIAFAGAYDFECDTDYAYGVINGFMVSITNVGSKKAAFINYFLPIEETEGGTFEYQISTGISALELNALNKCEVSDNGVYFCTSASLTAFDEAILKVCELLDEMGAEGADVCSDCGCDIDAKHCKALLNGGKLTMLCDDCADYFEEQLIKASASEKKPSKIKGVIGSVVGGLLGLLLVMALYIWLPFSGQEATFGGALSSDMLIFTLPASALVSVFCFLFYRIFTGVKGNKRFLCGVITSVIFSMLNTYGATAVLYTKQFGVGKENLSKVFGIILKAPFTDEVYRSDFLKYLFFGLIAVVIVGLVYSIIFDDAKHSVPTVISIGAKDGVEDDDEYTEYVAEDDDEEDEEDEESGV